MCVKPTLIQWVWSWGGLVFSTDEISDPMAIRGTRGSSGTLGVAGRRLGWREIEKRTDISQWLTALHAFMLLSVGFEERGSKELGRVTTIEGGSRE